MESTSNDPKWSNNLKSQQFQIDLISNKLSNLESSLKSSSHDSQTELLAISTLLTHLKSKTNSIKTPNSETLETKTLDEILTSIHSITDITETLITRVASAESEAWLEKQKVKLGLEEIEKKKVQIELMESRVLEMEKFASFTNDLLGEMRERVEEMVSETARQRERATENEAELVRVKQDFESLRTYVGTLINARERVLDSEKTLQSVEKLFDRMMIKNTQLENEKAQKEIQITKLIEENVKLRANLDKKEAQLVAMNEQCKFMALTDRNF